MRGGNMTRHHELTMTSITLESFANSVMKVSKSIGSVLSSTILDNSTLNFFEKLRSSVTPI